MLWSCAEEIHHGMEFMETKATHTRHPQKSKRKEQEGVSPAPTLSFSNIPIIINLGPSFQCMGL